MSSVIVEMYRTLLVVPQLERSAYMYFVSGETNGEKRWSVIGSMRSSEVIVRRKLAST